MRLDEAVAAMGLVMLRTPVWAPKANARCERLVGSIRRECLDFLIPFGERYLRRILKVWVTHYNHGRVHMGLGPDIPAPLKPPPARRTTETPLAARWSRSSVPSRAWRLHHEYWLSQLREGWIPLPRITTAWYVLQTISARSPRVRPRRPAQQSVAPKKNPESPAVCRP